MNRKTELVYFYYGFPKNWAKVQLTEVDLVKIENKLKFKNNLLVLNQGIEKVVKYLLENFYGKVQGFDFSELQSNIINNEININELNLKEYNVVYNIGTELANNKAYSGQILKSLYSRVLKVNKKLILSGVSSSELERTYGFNLKNML